MKPAGKAVHVVLELTPPGITQMGQLTVHTHPGITQMGQLAVHTPPGITQMGQLAEVAIDDASRARAERITDAAGQHIEPPAGGLCIVPFGVAFQPRHKVRRAALLQPG